MKTARIGAIPDRWLPYALLAPLFAFLAAFFLVPLVQVMWLSVSDPTLGVGHYFKVIADPYYRRVMLDTMATALFVTVICVLLAAKPGKVPPADWFKDLSGIGTVEPALARAGFNADEVAKIARGNWLRVYRAVFGDNQGPVTVSATASRPAP